VEKTRLALGLLEEAAIPRTAALRPLLASRRPGADADADAEVRLFSHGAGATGPRDRHTEAAVGWQTLLQGLQTRDRSLEFEFKIHYPARLADAGSGSFSVFHGTGF
jgi:hypothetical protein